MLQVVGIADMKLSANPEDVLITYALGSCLGITVYDPFAGIGGMVHVMLPLSTMDSKKADSSPSMFVDTAVPQLFTEMYKLGAQKSKIVVAAAGGAFFHSTGGDDYFQIGKRNFVMLRKLLWKNGLLLKSHDVGGSISRTMSLYISNGEVTVKSSGVETTLVSPLRNGKLVAG